MPMTSRTAAFTADSPWIRRAPRPSATVRLICLPFAGGGASVFRSLAGRVPDSVEVVAVQLPGREDRSGEDPPHDIDYLVLACAVLLRPYCTMPYVLYGHCAGALLAYEVAQTMGRRYGMWPSLLVAGAQPAPHLHRGDDVLHTLPDADLVEAIRQRGGLADQIADNPRMVEYLLPLLRSDFELWERYQHQPGPPLPCPVVALRGRDDEIVTAETTEPWRDHTSVDFSDVVVDGGHYFITELPDASADQLARVVLAETDPRKG